MFDTETILAQHNQYCRLHRSNSPGLFCQAKSNTVLLFSAGLLGATKTRRQISILPGASCVRVMVFISIVSISGHFEICNLQIPHRPFTSWFESSQGSQPLFSSACEFPCSSCVRMAN